MRNETLIDLVPVAATLLSCIFLNLKSSDLASNCPLSRLPWQIPHFIVCVAKVGDFCNTYIVNEHCVTFYNLRMHNELRDMSHPSLGSGALQKSLTFATPPFFGRELIQDTFGQHGMHPVSKY